MEANERDWLYIDFRPTLPIDRPSAYSAVQQTDVDDAWRDDA